MNQNYYATTRARSLSLYQFKDQKIESLMRGVIMAFEFHIHMKNSIGTKKSTAFVHSFIVCPKKSEINLFEMYLQLIYEVVNVLSR